MNTPKKMLACLFMMGMLLPATKAQGLLNKIKQKANDVAEKAIDKKTDELLNGKKKPSENEQGNIPGNGINTGNVAGDGLANGSSGGPRNKVGAGLISSPPDVKLNLNSSETAFKSGNYGEARYALQQAILGVEMEIGQELLKSLPETVSGLPKQAEKDQVTSTGWGWAGLTIHREYLKDDKQLSMTIANNSLMMSAMNMFLSNSGYAQSTGGEQKWKQTTLKGNRAVIEYDDSSGYKLSVPIGQSSILIFEGINFSDENDLMNAANQFDIDRIKKTLGEGSGK